MLKMRAVIVEAEGDEATLRAVLDVFRGAIADGQPVAPQPASSRPPVPSNGRLATPAPPTRRATVTDGSPASRVLELAKTPVTRSALLDQAESIGLKAGTVSALVEQLVASKHLTRSGKSRATRYVAR